MRRINVGIVGLVGAVMVSVIPVGAVAQSAAPDGDAAAFVTGTLGAGQWSPTPGDRTEHDGVIQTRGFAFSGLGVTSSDPRLWGAYSYVGNSDEYPGGVRSQVGRIEIRNDDGGWVGTSTEYVADGDRETIQLAGDGAYAGLTAYVVVNWGEPTRPFEGIIFPGEMPELPPAE